VVAVEIDPRKVELARHNARIYGVEDMIEFVVGDFFRLAPSLKVRSVLLDEYIQKRHALWY
jgi:trimethylguanosine synthase